MSEHEHQAALIKWADLTALPPADDIEPLARVGHYLYAIPNGGLRKKATAGKLKAEGVREGAPDLALDLARRGCHGLRIEMKNVDRLGRRAGRISDEQLAWITRMERAGYLCAVCWGWDQARAVICDYLGIREPHSERQPRTRGAAP